MDIIETIKNYWVQIVFDLYKLYNRPSISSKLRNRMTIKAVIRLLFTLPIYSFLSTRRIKITAIKAYKFDAVEYINSVIILFVIG